MSAVTCRSCGSPQLEVVLSLGQTPLANSLLTKAQLKDPEPTYPLDLAYCRALSNVYVRYIGHDWQYGDKQLLQANNDAQVAVAQCEQGNAAPAIPVLERELVKNKFTLPARG